MNARIDATSGRLGKAIGALVASMAIGLLAPAMAAAAADLSVTKSDGADPISRGQTLTYTIVVHNAGPAVATATEVEDKLPGGLDFVSASTTAGTCSTQGKTVTCALGTLAALADETVTIRTRVTKNKGTIDNTATVSTTEPDPASPNNSDTERTTIRKAATGPTCQGSVATIIGTGAGETLIGTGHRDVIIAGGGNDVVLSGGGSDKVCAGSGRDLVRSGPKGDAVKGGGGADRLRGGGGADALRGGPGRDRLRGGPGPDLLAGGLGFDVCRGGAGADTLRSCP